MSAVDADSRFSTLRPSYLVYDMKIVGILFTVIVAAVPARVPGVTLRSISLALIDNALGAAPKYH